jgi:hypothetical protein
MWGVSTLFTHWDYRVFQRLAVVSSQKNLERVAIGCAHERAYLIHAEHAERREESQWRQKSADKKRFAYQRAVVGG